VLSPQSMQTTLRTQHSSKQGSWYQQASILTSRLQSGLTGAAAAQAAACVGLPSPAHKSWRCNQTSCRQLHWTRGTSTASAPTELTVLRLCFAS
jgi:hypothetical protein